LPPSPQQIYFLKEMSAMKQVSIWVSLRTVAMVLAILMAISVSGNAATYQTIATLPGALGPGALIFDSAGNIYGTTSSGGAFNGGMIFKLSSGSGGVWNETVLYDFPGAFQGCWPNSPLVFDQAGNLYGTTSGCGRAKGGVAFELSPNGNGGWTETVIYNNFSGKRGVKPFGGLAIDKAGNLYGATASGGVSCPDVTGGCGTVFRLKRNQKGVWVEKILHTFTGSPDGASPYRGVALDSAGNLYGTTFFGGSSPGCLSCGSVFKVSPTGNTWTEQVIYNFAGGPDGANPYATVVLDEAGNLYGTTSGGGDAQKGVVFRLAPIGSGWTETAIHSFGGSGDGGQPTEPVTRDSNGNLYGVAPIGDSSGVAFKLTPAPSGPWPETILSNVGLSSAPLTWNPSETILYGSTWPNLVYEIAP
jgi:uncharacterized repeat protein (TIGR03803 family)